MAQREINLNGQFERPIRKLQDHCDHGMAGPKKEKVFHPDSRKAAQLARTHLRKSKLAKATAKRAKKHAAQGQSSILLYEMDRLLAPLSMSDPWC